MCGVFRTSRLLYNDFQCFSNMWLHQYQKYKQYIPIKLWTSSSDWLSGNSLAGMHVSTFSRNLRATSNILLCGVSITVWGLSCDTWSGWGDGGILATEVSVFGVHLVLCQPELRGSIPNIGLGYPLQYDIRRFYFNRDMV